MSSAGQILNILSQLDRGASSLQYGEKKARKAEVAHQGKMMRNLSRGLRQAKDKGKSGQLTNALIMLALGATGAGIPAMMAAQLATSLATGSAGAKKAKKHMEGLTGLAGTKFGREVDTYTSEVGSDVLSKALMDTMITGMTMGLGGGAMGEGLKKAGGQAKTMLGKFAESGVGKTIKTVGDVVTKPIKEIPGLTKAIKHIAVGPNEKGGVKALLGHMKGFADMETPLGVVKGSPDAKGLSKWLGAVYDEADKPTILGRMLDTAKAEYAKDKTATKYLEYEVPETLGIASKYGGYY